MNNSSSSSTLSNTNKKDRGKVSAVIGLQWGDEGKGKLVDSLAKNNHIIARYNGGANAGHTIYYKNKKFATNLLPSGVLTENCMNLIGNGVVVEVEKLFSELYALDELLNEGISDENKKINVFELLKVSDRCHIVFQFHYLNTFHLILKL
jgi:adenylosuccinate synthase